MTTNYEITDKELREVYELLTKEQLIESLIRMTKNALPLTNRVDNILLTSTEKIC